jgi:predicted nucleic acid-binding protein
LRDTSVAVLIDATVVSNFAAIGRLDLLRGHLGSAFLADAVHAELIRGAGLGYSFLTRIEDEIADLAEHGWLRLTRPANEPERSAFRTLPARIQLGEAMSLAIAGERGWVFLTDDRKARKVAAENRIAVSGTVGVLIGLIRSGTLTLEEGNSLLAAMVEQAGDHSPVKSLAEALLF